jgi:N-acetylmuramoyl-L-alanine amidase
LKNALKTAFLCYLIEVSATWCQVLAEPIKVVYPRGSAEIRAAKSFIVGEVEPGHTLTCNGQAVRTNEFGFFAHVVPLKPGINPFSLLLDDGRSHVDLQIKREQPSVPIGIDELKLRSFAPSQDMGVKAGDVISLSIHATPDSKVLVEIGQRRVILSALAQHPTGGGTVSEKRARATRPYTGRTPHGSVKSGSKSGSSLGSGSRSVSRDSKEMTNINQGQEVANGEVYQRQTPHSADLYTGFYKVMPEDHWQGVNLKFSLNHQGKETSITSHNRISTVSQPLIAQTNKPQTVVRLGPGLARTTPLTEGIRLFIDGWVGEQMRVCYANDRHVFIDRKDLLFENGNPGQKSLMTTLAPQAVAQTINVHNDTYGQVVSIPLSQRLPYQIEQKLNPNVLIIRLFGATADTDWITAPGEAEHVLRADPNASQILIDHVSWKQPADDVYEVTIHLAKNRQWGYKAFYEGTALCLDVKREVTSVASDLPLQGVKVCVDPGHGGSEKGSIGCSGEPESQLNLAIASKFKMALQQQGATVIMTRETQGENPSLNKRVDIATNEQADFLISIHNNALPDGRDPWQEHGTSDFWYHPQSMELARCLKDAVVEKIGFPDLGARWQNLALARGTAMPSVLVEVGFMIHPDEFAKLINENTQTEIAQALCAGLIKYVHPENADDGK